MENYLPNSSLETYKELKDYIDFGIEENITLHRSPIDPEKATHISTEMGNQVVLFGAEEASRWTIDS